MGKKFDEYNKGTVTFFGFKFESKSFWISMGCAVFVLLLLAALTAFGVNISWYGVCFGLGFLVALVLSGQLCNERDINPDFPYTLIWWVFPSAIIGARLYFLIFDGSFDSIWDIFKIWEGGLAVYGGIIGGFVGLAVCCLIHKVHIAKMTDVVAPLLVLGQSFGRIGCIFGHCCYGVEVTNKALQWFPIALNINDTYYYATNFYESIFDLIIFFVLTIVLRKNKITGVPTFGYMFCYGLVRFILEAYREKGQTLFIGNYPVSQLLSIALVLVGAIGISVLLLVNNRKKDTVTE
ncbi:MAG: prolipoprotein diacylglyceryl transferase [Clostridiales bacterium]|nr:prolipoprotein diacylglyceryl transferase [Clostridiales bacterium]